MSEANVPIRVLLVDDETDFLESTSAALSRRGFEVKTAPSGPEGLRILESNGIEVLVLDLKMPGMNGLEVLEKIREKGIIVRVLILTGHGTAPDAFRSARLGIIDFLAKPIDIELLAEKLKGTSEAVGTREGSKTWDERPRLLIVDDEQELLDSLKKVLGRRGFDVTVAADASQALRILESEIIEVAILDIKMPGMDGLELLQRMKSIYPEIEAVFLTGHPSKETAFQSMKGGAFQYVTKPPDIQELSACVYRAYERQRNRSETETLRTIMDLQESISDY